MKVSIQNHSSHRVPKAFIEKVVAATAKQLVAKHKGLKAKSKRLKTKHKRLKSKLRVQDELTIVFLNIGPARKLNKQFRGRDYATDILSFEARDEGSFGEFVMCPQVLARQAAEHGWAFQFECGLMIIHGILHLLGYDHVKSAREAKKMYALQSELVWKILGKKLEW